MCVVLRIVPHSDCTLRQSNKGISGCLDQHVDLHPLLPDCAVPHLLYELFGEYVCVSAQQYGFLWLKVLQSCQTA